MINQMVSHPDAGQQDLSSLRVCTSAGEALPVELYRRWKETVRRRAARRSRHRRDVAHLHLQPARRRPAGHPRDGGAGLRGQGLRRGRTRAAAGRDRLALGARRLARHRLLAAHGEDCRRAFAASGTCRATDSPDGGRLRRPTAVAATRCSRWRGSGCAPSEVENCLLCHPLVEECVVVGVVDEHGLTKPHAFVVPRENPPELAEELQEFVRTRLEPYKAPRQVAFLKALPRTHLGKVDRGSSAKRERGLTSNMQWRRDSRGRRRHRGRECARFVRRRAGGRLHTGPASTPRYSRRTGCIPRTSRGPCRFETR